MRALVLAAALLVLAGCSSPASDSDSSGSTGPASSSNPGFAPPQPQTVHMTASGQFSAGVAFEPNEFTVISGGEVTVLLHNSVKDGVSHNWKVDGVATVPTTSAGASNEVTFTAPAPGTYTFYCSIGSHRAAGLEGTMTVAVA